MAAKSESYPQKMVYPLPFGSYCVVAFAPGQAAYAAVGLDEEDADTVVGFIAPLVVDGIEELGMLSEGLEEVCILLVVPPIDVAVPLPCVLVLEDSTSSLCEVTASDAEVPSLVVEAAELVIVIVERSVVASVADGSIITLLVIDVVDSLDKALLEELALPSVEMEEVLSIVVAGSVVLAEAKKLVVSVISPVGDTEDDTPSVELVCAPVGNVIESVMLSDMVPLLTESELLVGCMVDVVEPAGAGTLTA